MTDRTLLWYHIIAKLVLSFEFRTCILDKVRCKEPS